MGGFLKAGLAHIGPEIPQGGLLALTRSHGSHSETFEGGHGIGRRLEVPPTSLGIAGKAIALRGPE